MNFIEQSPRIRFILVDTGHPGNIGATARAIQTMGFSELWVVNPQEPQYRTHPEAIAFATHSVNILESSRCVSSLEEALVGVTKAYSMTGYDREFGPPIKGIIEATEDMQSHMLREGSADIALVFGTERSGLTNEQIQQCQMCVAIPANPKCDSLNLAQAVQVAAYQLQVTLRGSQLDAHAIRFDKDAPATHESLNGFFQHLEEALISCGALDPEKPKFMMQRLRQMFSRAEPTQIEVDLMRGICAAIICPKKYRHGNKISDRICRK